MARGEGFDSSLLRGSLVALVTAKVIGLVVIFDPTGFDAFPLPKSVFSRAVAWLLAGLIALALIRYGRAIVPPSRLHPFVAAFVAANVLSAAFAENTYVALFGEREKYLGLSFVADMFVLYSAVAISFRRAADWALLAGGIAVAGLASVGYAAMQSLGVDPVRWDVGGERPFGTFGNADMLGHFLSLAFGASIGVALFARDLRSALPRVAAAGYAWIALVVATAIATRGSLLGFAAALAAAPFVYLRLRGWDRRAVERALVGSVTAVTLLSSVLALSPLAERVRHTVQGVQVRDRLLLYEVAIRALADRPLFGYGPDTFAVAHPRYRQPASTVVLGIGPANSAHSWPLQSAATLGLAGLLALLALLGVFAWSLWARVLPRAPNVGIPLLLASAAYWGHGLVAVDAVSVDWFPWLAFGSVAALERGDVVPAMARRGPHPLAAALLLGAAASAALAGVVALQSNRHALVARLSWEAGDADTAVAAALSSVSDDPGRADRWNWLGLALELRGAWEAAGGAYAEAARRAPHEAAYWSNVARARARQALADQDSDARARALEAARMAVAVDPNAPEPNAVLAEIGNLFGEYELALAAAARAIRLYAKEPNYDDVAAFAALGVADASSARSTLEDLLGVRDSATLRIALAEVSLRLNDHRAARLHAQRALELDPTSGEARAILADTERP